jgi:hypothetical protein
VGVCLCVYRGGDRAGFIVGIEGGRILWEYILLSATEME